MTPTEKQETNSNQVIENISSNCQTCGLLNQCKNKEKNLAPIRPLLDYRLETKNTNTLLVVADYTGEADASKGQYFNDPHRAYPAVIQTVLKGLKCRYVFVTALACGITDKDTKLTKKQYNACFQEKLKPLILKHKPRAIVCLGKSAMDAVLQDQAPKTMKEILKTGMNVEWHEGEIKVLNSLVMAVDHPAKFFNDKVDKVRLQSLYQLIFNKAEKYCLETEVRKPVEYELITTPARFYAVAGLPFKEMAFDIENRHSKKDLTRNIIWKCNSSVLSLAFTFYEEKLKIYRNFVVVGEALKDKLCLEKLFRGRNVVAHNCLHASSLVTLADGTRKTISSMVAEKHEGPVVTLNEKTGKLENKRVKGWIHNPRRDWKDWLRVRTSGNGILSLTKDHEVLTSKGRIKAEDLKLEDLIHTNSYDFTPAQKALLVGSLMGDGSLVKPKKRRGKTFGFKVSHADKQHDYLDFKAEVLKDLNPTIGILAPSNRGFSRNTSMKNLCISRDVRVNSLVEKAPLRNKELTPEDLTWLENPGVLAIWHCDDGSCSNGNRSQICVSAFGLDNANKLVAKLNSLKYNASLYIRPNDAQLYIHLTREGAAKFYEDIASYVPECMQNKLPLQYRGRYVAGHWFKKVEKEPFFDKVVLISQLAKKENASRYEGISETSERGIGPYQFCLEVEDNNNFFAGELCVSNCRHDIQGIYRHLGVDVFALAKGVEDTLAMFYLTNQNRVTNGLKDLSAQYLGIYDYADEVKRFEIEANIRLKGLRSQAIENYKQKQKEYKLYCEALTWKLNEEKVAAVKARKFEQALSEYEDIKELEKLLFLCKEAVDTLPPEGSCDYGDLPISILAQYNAEDTYCTLKLKREILPYLSKYDKTVEEGAADPLWDPVAYDLFKKALKLVCAVERNGLPMDMDSLQGMKKDLIETELQVRKELLEVPIIKDVLLELDNIKLKEEKGKLTEEDLLKEVSPTKAKFITTLCEKLKLHHHALLTKGNNWSYTSKKCISNIKDSFKDREDEEGKQLYEIFKSFAYVGNNRQVRSKFISNWEQYWVPETGRFHPTFVLNKNQSLVYANKEADGGAQSGRLSATQINTTQIRKVGYLRKHFKAPPGYVFVEVDYSSLEPVLLSYLSGCERLKEVFRRRLDIYRVTANDIYDFGVNLNNPDNNLVKKQLAENVDELFRDRLKVGFLAWCYGRGIFTFARDMKITEDEAREFFRKAREMYSEIYDWKEGIISCIEEGRMVHTMFGRKRDFPINSPRPKDREDFKRYKKDLSKAIRVGVNFPVQSLGSDICLWQASRIQEWIEKEYLQDVIQIVNLVHDAVWFLVKETQLPWAVKEIQTIMEDVNALPFGMDVPLRTEAEHGPTLASYLKKNKGLFLPYE